MNVIEERSTITAKGQTTVPRVVRQLLGLKEGDEIAFRVEGEKITISSVNAEHEDPALGEFLALLAKDLETRPASVKALSKDFATRMKALVKNSKVDLAADIDGDVDL